MPAIAVAQAPEATDAKTETIQDLIGRLTPQQQESFDQGTTAFNEQRYVEALAIFRQMLTQLPSDPILAKFASEAALDTGDTAFAIATLKPLAQAAPNDWQAWAILARACAESGDNTGRDTAMSHLLDLHDRHLTPIGMKQYIVERLKSGNNTLTIRASLEPVGRYKVYDLGQVTDPGGNTFLRITVESSDADQVPFMREHPKEAAAGLRSFSLDAYRETGLNSNGQRTQTHSTYKFFVGQPSYQTVREEFIAIAAGRRTAVSSRTNLIVP